MPKEKKSIINSAKQCVAETIKLLKQFKWYVTFDIMIFALFLSEYINPPAADEMIWGSEATLGAWNYQNQQLYIVGCKYSLIIITLLFLTGTSNMRNHPTLAKLMFLLPAFVGWID